jgi:IS30 family transposase
MPKGISTNNYTDEQVLIFSDGINAMPRKRLNLYTPEKLFEEHLDLIYKLKIWDTLF